MAGNRDAHPATIAAYRAVRCYAGSQGMLSRSDKILYHQIHPAKLAVDIAGGAVSTWLLWRHQLLLGMVIAWLPSIALTAAMVRWMDFERQRDSAFGRYVAHHMTHAAWAVRFAGQGTAWASAWLHAPWGIAAGAAIIVAGWTYSLPSWRARACVDRPV